MSGMGYGWRDPTTVPAVQLPGAGGGTEPRVAVGPGNHSWLITNDGNGTAIVYGSTDGQHWTKTSGDPAGQAEVSFEYFQLHGPQMLFAVVGTELAK